MIRSRLLLSVAALFVAACEAELDPAEVVGHEWRLSQVRRTDGSTVDPGARRYTLTLEAGGRASVRSDCNACFGGYTLAGAALAVTPLACTRAHCGDQSLDPEYPRLLETALRLDVDGRRLAIATPEATLRYTR